MQLLDNLNRGGVTRAAVDIAAAVNAAGGASVIVSGGGVLEHELARIGAAHEVIQLDTRNPLTQRRNASRLMEIIEKFDVDVVHAHARGPAWAGHIAADKTERAFVATVHNPYASERGLKRKWNSVMFKGDRVIVPSEFIARHIRENFQVDRSHLRLIPRGVDFLRFDPEQVSAERVIQLATRWRLPDGLPVVTMADRLTEEWDHGALIEALGTLGDMEFTCLLVGADTLDGPYRASLESKIKQAGLAGKALIVEDCIDMPAAYMLSDVVVSLPSQPEGFGRIISEAQALGRLVVAADKGSAGEQIIDGHTGFLVPDGDKQALADTLRKALTLEPEQRRLISYASIGNTRSNFSKDRMCALHLGLYKELMRAGAYRIARDLKPGIHTT
jgi:glycosyltransferase involved in cell wall biosynthesis